MSPDWQQPASKTNPIPEHVNVVADTPQADMSRVPNPDEARRLARLRFDRPPRPDVGLDRTVLLRALQTLHGDNVPLYSRGIITTPEEYADKIMECANADFAGQPIGNDVEQTMRDDDVERLAEVIRLVRANGVTEIEPSDAEMMGRVYARLSESGSPTPPHDPNHPGYLCAVPDCPRYVGALDNYSAPTPPGEE